MQHYKKRNPPWIKLYADLLDDVNFDFIGDRSKLLFFCLLLFASRQGNKIPYNLKWLNKKLPIFGDITDSHIEELITHGFIELYDNASITLAERYQDAIPETETEQRQSREEGASDNSFTLQQVQDAGCLIGITDTECELFYDYYNAQGWRFGSGLPITDLKSALTRWRNNGHKFDRPETPSKTDKSDELIRRYEKNGMVNWVKESPPETLTSNGDFMRHIKDPKFRQWAENINSNVRNIA